MAKKKKKELPLLGKYLNKKPSKKEAAFLKKVSKNKVVKHLQSHRKQRITLYVFVGFMSFLLFTMWVFRPIDHDIKRLGVSFSIKYAEELTASKSILSLLTVVPLSLIHI